MQLIRTEYASWSRPAAQCLPEEKQAREACQSGHGACRTAMGGLSCPRYRNPVTEADPLGSSRASALGVVIPAGKRASIRVVESHGRNVHLISSAVVSTP